jgi:putative transposase
MNAVTELSQTVSRRRSCAVFGVARSRWYRARRPAAADTPRETRPRRRPRWTLPAELRARVLATLNSEACRDLAPRAVYARLLDKGTYLCSWRTMYRVLAEHGQVRERRAQRPPRTFVSPHLVARAPKQVYTWDITKLPTRVKGQFLYLYIMIDLYSRYVAGWMIDERECGELAEDFIAQTMAKEGIEPGHVTLHSDRGSPMTCATVSDLLEELGIARSLSRPRVPNDNAFSESQIKTIKYRPTFPRRFRDRQHADTWGQATFHWYNHDHHHGSLALLPPAVVHAGQAEAVLAKRQEVLDQAYRGWPERFPHGRPLAGSLPPKVCINETRLALAPTAVSSCSAPQAPSPLPKSGAQTVSMAAAGRAKRSMDTGEHPATPSPALIPQLAALQ